MKKIFKYSCIAALFMLGTIASAQDNGINLRKKVTGSGGEYNLTLEAYVTGTSQTTVTEEVKPCDIVIILDLSSSMTSNNVTVNKERTQMTNGSTLSTSDTYIATIDGKEYYLKGFSTTVPDDKYSGRTSQSYSYTDLRNKEYYILVDGNYYLIHRDKDGSAYSYSACYLYFEKDGVTYYLKGSSYQTTKYTVNGYDTDIWTGVLYTHSSTNKTIYYYRYGTTVPTSSTAGNEFYTGESNFVVGGTAASGVGTVTKIEKENTGTESITRLEAIKRASKSFVQTVYDNNPEIGYHKLAVVGYNKAAYTPVSLQDVTGTSVGTIQTTINNISTSSIPDGSSSYTDPVQGLFQTVGIFSATGVKDDGRKKVVVFFTDGNPCPSGTNNFSAEYAINAVNCAYVLKQPATQSVSYGTYNGTGFDASIYSVAVLSSENNQIRHFLHWVSSNYKDKHFTSGNGNFNTSGDGGSEAPHDFYQLSNGSDLTSIFDKIASEASTGGATTKLTAETTTVVDVIAADFTLPEGADVNSIQVFTAPAKNQAPYDSAGRKWYTFGARETLSGASIEIGEDAGHNPKITVKGFDFSKDDTSVERPDGNWVGDRKKNGSIIGYYGRELVIVIPIKLKPDYQGGYETPTNTTQSGIYQEGKDDPIAVFNVPTVDFPSIAIVKKGLKKGESATFTVTRTTALKMDDDGKVVYGSDGYPETVPGIQAPYRVILTGTGDDSGAYIVLKDVIEGDYVIREEGWSWAYEVQTANSQVGRLLCKKNFENDNIEFHGAVDFHGTKCMIFNFENAAKTDAPDHAEAKVNNDFSKNTATTVTSKEQPASR